MTRAARRTLLWTRKTAVLVAGCGVLLAGVALFVLPGPGLLVAAGGLAILSIEFEWARRWLVRLRARADRGLARWEARVASRAAVSRADGTTPVEPIAASRRDPGMSKKQVDDGGGRWNDGEACASAPDSTS